MEFSIFLLVAKLLTEEMQTPAVPPTKVSPKQRKVSPSKRRRKEHADFSDGNDVDDASAEELEIESVERLNYNHDQQGTLKQQVREAG